jgi:hypothetical protein
VGTGPDRPVIIGAGLAGLMTALCLAPHPVLVLSRAPVGTEASSAWAQGGVAAAVGPDDSPLLHLADTLAAGAGLCDPVVSDLILRAGPGTIAALVAHGAEFDRGHDGSLQLGLEAAHGRRRIVHAAGAATGAEIMRALAEAVRRTPSVTVLEGMEARRLLARDNRVLGVVAVGPHGPIALPASRVVLAIGGIGGLFAHTTNPRQAWGQGLLLAGRAGAVMSGMEFVQFLSGSALFRKALAWASAPSVPGQQSIAAAFRSVIRSGRYLPDHMAAGGGRVTRSASPRSRVTARPPTFAPQGLRCSVLCDAGSYHSGTVGLGAAMSYAFGVLDKLRSASVANWLRDIPGMDEFLAKPGHAIIDISAGSHLEHGDEPAAFVRGPVEKDFRLVDGRAMEAFLAEAAAFGGPLRVGAYEGADFGASGNEPIMAMLSVSEKRGESTVFSNRFVSSGGFCYSGRRGRRLEPASIFRPLPATLQYDGECVPAGPRQP